ncbi:MAG TPA: hypothetical protein VG649_01610 [Candidatus Angelobacter sp.]|nr:hypothetical protein [Candidatus Angelobacter sp.]
MGNFLVVLPAQNEPVDAEALFSNGIELAQTLLSTRPGSRLHGDWFHAASFPRQNGSGSSIAHDPRTGSWLLALGAWFHADGLACGDEAKLLDRYINGDGRQLGLDLEGSFVVVIGDGHAREVVVITDLCGNLHSFIRHTSRGIAISGSSLLLAALDNFHLDPLAVRDFLATGVIYQGSVFREVRKFGPAVVERIKSGSVAIRAERYWSPASIQPESIGGREAEDALWSSLCEAARKVGKAFPHPLCDLTGGYDSRAEVAAFAATGVPITTSVSGPPDSPDVSVSRGLAQRAGLPHLYFEPPADISLDSARKALPLTDGEYDLILYSRVQRIHQSGIGKYDVSVNGSFGEVARGYWWELLFPRIGDRTPLDARMLAARRFAAGPFDASLFRSGEELDLVTHLARGIEQANQGIGNFPNTVQMDSAYILMRMQHWHGRIMSSTNRLWPCVSPFMFRSVLEVMLSTRARDRQRSLLIRRMLARFQPEWADYPLEHGYPAAPATWKNFYRFAPLAGYYAGRIIRKVSNRIGWSSPRAILSILAQQRLQLWSQDDLRCLLDPRQMRLGQVLHQPGLNAFLQRSQEAAFPFDEQWTRMLTLELALQTLVSQGVQMLVD